MILTLKIGKNYPVSFLKYIKIPPLLKKVRRLGFMRKRGKKGANVCQCWQIISNKALRKGRKNIDMTTISNICFVVIQLSRIRHVSFINRVTASLIACFFICQKPKGAEKGQNSFAFSIKFFNNTSLCLLGYMGVYLHCCFHVGMSYTFHDRFYRYVQFSK